MFSFDDILGMGYSAEEILSGIEAQMGIDDIAFHMYHFLNDRDEEISEELEKHYDNHCR